MNLKSAFLFGALLLGAGAAACAETVRNFSTSEDASPGSGDDDDPRNGNKGDDAGKAKPPTHRPKDAGDERDASLGLERDAAAVMPVEDSSAPMSLDSGMIEPPADSGTTAPCKNDLACDDGVDCTVDTCTPRGCSNVPDNAVCSQLSGGVCDATNGCQYPVCNSETCSAGSCQEARCEGVVCVRESLCARGEMCCAGQCAPAGCDDDIECTTDQCGLTGCEHNAVHSACDDGNDCTDETCEVEKGCVPSSNTVPCDDGVYCNGADTCSGGRCATHPGDPCPGQSRCDENSNTCSGCVTDDDCPSPVEGGWGSCDFGGDACFESGTQKRTVTAFTCEGGSCKAAAEDEQQDCARETDGISCDDTSVGTFGPCLYSATCATAGSKTRDRTDYKCASGQCTAALTMEQAACNRITQGTNCGTCQTCGSNGSCNTMPEDDAACGVIDCPTDTTCADYSNDLTTARCQAFGQCKTPASCQMTPQDFGVSCDLCAVCDGAGSCNVPPADDEQCGEILCPASTDCVKYPASITTDRCEGLLMCVDSNDCVGEFADPGTDCSQVKGEVLQCSPQGECSDPLVTCGEEAKYCPSGACCYGLKAGLTCNPRGECDVANTVRCDEKADCPGATVCCAQTTLIEGDFGSACTSLGNCPIEDKGVDVLCRDHVDCPQGYSCTDTAGPGYGACALDIIFLPPFQVEPPALGRP